MATRYLLEGMSSYNSVRPFLFAYGFLIYIVVIRAKNISWKPDLFQSKTPELYATVTLGEETDRTTTIQDASPRWEMELSL